MLESANSELGSTIMEVKASSENKRSLEFAFFFYSKYYDTIF